MMILIEVIIYLLALTPSFFYNLFSKGNQNGTASAFVEVVPVLEIKPRTVTKRVGKY